MFGAGAGFLAGQNLVLRAGEAIENFGVAQVDFLNIVGAEEADAMA